MISSGKRDKCEMDVEFSEIDADSSEMKSRPLNCGRLGLM